MQLSFAIRPPARGRLRFRGAEISHQGRVGSTGRWDLRAFTADKTSGIDVRRRRRVAFRQPAGKFKGACEAPATACQLEGGNRNLLSLQGNLEGAWSPIPQASRELHPANQLAMLRRQAL